MNEITSIGEPQPTASNGAPPSGAQDAATLAPDGPDEMGRELAEGPAAVAATLAALEPLAPSVAGLFASTRRNILLGTGASLAVARAAAPLWRVACREQGFEREVVVRESSSPALGSADGALFLASDLVVAISQSGTSPETLAATRLASRGGSRTVALTARPESPLAGAAELVVLLASGEEKGASTKSELCSLAALLALPGAMPAGRPFRTALAERLAAVVADWSSAAAFGAQLAAAERLWVLGFGSADGIGAALGLLWHEKVRRAAVTSTPSEFRHGLIEAVGPGDAIVLFDVDAPVPSRAAYLALLRTEVARVGARLVMVAPDLGPGAPGLAIAASPGGPAALEALLRAQQLARAAAHAAGTYRDGFLILGVVVQPAPFV